MLLKERRDEQQVLILLSRLFGFAIASVDYDLKDAVGFLQGSEHDDGYRHSLLITWLKDKGEPVNSFVDIARGMSDSLNVPVLLEEPYTTKERWILCQPDKSFSEVRIRETGDSVEPIADF